MQMEREFTFRNTNLTECSYKFFADIRNQKKFCDIEFTAGELHISAHRVILAAAIPLFREASLDPEETVMPDIDSSVFQCLVDYAYSCELKITMENVIGLLQGATHLRMKEVQVACCDFLTQRLSPENVLNFRELADELSLTEFKEFIDFYVSENFVEVSKTEKFLNTPFMYVRELIGKDDLNVDSEEKVMESVLRWVKASVSDRSGNLPELLQQVRMVLLKPLYLTEVVEREELIRMSLLSRDLVDEARNYNLFPNLRKSQCSFSVDPRQFIKISEETQTKDNKMYGLEMTSKYTLTQLDVFKKTWGTKLIEEYYEGNGAIATSNKKMYFFHCGYAFEYDPEGNKYQLLSNLTLVWRKCTALVSVRDKIFICGGRASDDKATSLVENFDTEKHECTQVTSLRTARWSLNAVSLGNCIYALGGRDMSRNYDVVERYSLALGKWQHMSAMLTPRHAASAAVLHGKIYVCGGYTDIVESECMSTAEVYDPITNKWKQISSMNTKKSFFTLLAFSGNLYAVGGLDEHRIILNSCEVYDSHSDKWEYGPPADGCFFYGTVIR